MAAGHLKDFGELTEMFGIPEILGTVIEAMTNPRPRIMISLLIEEFKPLLLKQFMIPETYFDKVMAIMIFFRGFSEDFYFKEGKEILATHQYLGRSFGIMPEFF